MDCSASDSPNAIPRNGTSPLSPLAEAPSAAAQVHSHGSLPEDVAYSPTYRALKARLDAWAMWQEMSPTERLDVILTHYPAYQWFEPEVLAELAQFRHSPPGMWGKIKAIHKAIPGDPLDLEREVDKLLQTAQPPAGAPGDTKASGRPIVITMDTVKAQPVEWLWWPYIAVGKICMLDGDPGIGKTLLAIQLAASLSQGYPLPDQQGKPTLPSGGPATTLFIATEDGLADTLKPRLEAAQADCSKIHVFNEFLDEQGHTRAFTLEYLPHLEHCLQDKRPRLVVIDSIQAVMGRTVDIHRANQVTDLLRQLANLAEKYRCAIVCIRHPSKPGQNIAKLIHRGTGSVAFIGMARLGIFVEEHPQDRTKVLLVQSKSNAGEVGVTQIFSKRAGKFEWAGVSRLDSHMMAGSGKGPDPRVFLEACLWLETRLADGRCYPSEDIQDEMKDADFKHSTIWEAKKRLGVHHTKTASGRYVWYLPPLPPLTPPSISATSLTSSTSSTSYTCNKSITCEDTSAAAVSHAEPVEVSEVSDVDEVYEVDGVMNEPTPSAPTNGRPAPVDCHPPSVGPPPYPGHPVGNPFKVGRRVWVYQEDGTPLCQHPVEVLAILTWDRGVLIRCRLSATGELRWHDAALCVAVPTEHAP
jgi:DNA repair protein RadA/Sms